MTTILLSGLSIFACLLAFEYLARAVVRRIPRRVHHPGRRITFHVHPDVSQRLAPQCTTSYNDRGFRQASGAAPESGSVQILFTGGSVVESLFLDDGCSVPGRLEAHLVELSQASFCVEAAAKSGWRFHEVHRMLDELPENIHWDYMLIHCGSSDILQWVGKGAPNPLPPGIAPDSAVFDEFPEATFGGIRNSGTYALLRFLRGRLRTKHVVHGVGARIVKIRRLRQQATAISRVDGFEEVLRFAEMEARSVFRKALMKADRVMFVPQIYYYKTELSQSENAMLWSGAIERMTQSPPQEFLSPKLLHSLLQELNYTVAGAASELGIHVVDLSEDMELTEENFYDDFHLTEKGADAFSLLVAKAILRLPASRGDLDASLSRT